MMRLLLAQPVHIKENKGVVVGGSRRNKQRRKRVGTKRTKRDGHKENEISMFNSTTVLFIK